MNRENFGYPRTLTLTNNNDSTVSISPIHLVATGKYVHVYMYQGLKFLSKNNEIVKKILVYLYRCTFMLSPAQCSLI